MISIYEDEEIIAPQYDEIVIIGASFGARIATAIPKFDELITEIVLLYPRFNYDDMNMI
jgi:cephalosporin-C deacetylase-like acetyl esterase